MTLRKVSFKVVLKMSIGYPEIIGRMQLTRIFGVTQGFVEGLEREGVIHPKNVYVGKQLYKVFSARDVNMIRDCALDSATGSCRKRGMRLERLLREKKSRLFIGGKRG